MASMAILGAGTHLVRLHWLRILLVFSLFSLIGSTWLVLSADPWGREYYQIWPIRFLFPAISVYAFVVARRAGLTTRKTIPLAVLGGVAILWNLDSGIPVFGALIACLLARLVFGKARQGGGDWRPVVVATLVALAVMGLFMGYLWIKGGAAIDVLGWLKYQRIFYVVGFGMLPMPLEPHPWMAVLALYILALVVGLMALRTGCSTVTTDTLIFLGVLGLGLFTYFQGRSHIIVLSFVAWPAVLIAFILADRWWRATNLGLLPRARRWATVPVIAHGVLMVLVILGGLPVFVDVVSETARAVADRHRTPVAKMARFISGHVGEDGSAAIIDPGQATYFAETGLASALPGPGLREMLLAEDQEKVLRCLGEGTIPHVFIRRGRKGEIPEDYAAALETYRVADKSGKMLYLVPADAKP
jgi:hypothetical protein